LDRADKIFINQVWDCVLPLFAYDEYDEDGNIREYQMNPEGMTIFADRIMPDVLRPAFEETKYIISQGKQNINGTDYPVTATMFDFDDIQLIIDWKSTTKDNEHVFVISQKGFRNIFAEPVPKIPKKTIREDRYVDSAYMREIILFGEDDEKYKDLTPIELSVYNFLIKYFEIDEDGNVGFPKQEWINHTLLSAFYLSVREQGLKNEDFLSVLFMNAPEYGTGALRLKTRMFSADKIREWNAINAHISKINIKDEDYIHPEMENPIYVR
jgi:hypothetical protein